MNAPSLNPAAAGEQSIVDILEPLREPMVPSAWPPAPGWWVLALLALVLCTMLLRRLRAWHRRKEPLREAQRQVRALRASDISAKEKLTEIGQLQRRLAIHIAGRDQCAGLTGAAWADFLNGLAKDGKRYFDANLWDAAYRPEVNPGDVEDALDLTEDWLGSLERPA